MLEYEVNVLATHDGFALSVHPDGYTGSTRVASFPCWSELRNFFASLHLSEDLLRQVDDIGSHLGPGSAFKDKMFLPETVDEHVAAISAAPPEPARRFKTAA